MDGIKSSQSGILDDGIGDDKRADSVNMDPEANNIEEDGESFQPGRGLPTDVTYVSQQHPR
jgi:hypothetical protein